MTVCMECVRRPQDLCATVPLVGLELIAIPTVDAIITVHASQVEDLN